MNITNEIQLETLLNEMLKVFSPKRKFLTELAEVHLAFLFGLVASAVIYHFGVTGWGLQFLVYVVVFEIQQTGFVWLKLWYIKRDSITHLPIYRFLQVVVCVVTALLSVMFIMWWKIPILLMYFFIVWTVLRLFKWRDDKLEHIPNLGILPYLQRPDCRLVTVLFAAYQNQMQQNNSKNLFNNEVYRNRFFTVALHSLERFYAHPDEEIEIVQNLNNVIGNILLDFTKEQTGI